VKKICVIAQYNINIQFIIVYLHNILFFMLQLHQWYSLSENQVLEEIGKRLKAIRLNQNITQKELGELIGKGAEEISKIEGGKPITLISFLRILRALNKLEDFEQAIKPPGISPMKMMELQEKQRKRASKK
jgi:hypothetical protein